MQLMWVVHAGAHAHAGSAIPVVINHGPGIGLYPCWCFTHPGHFGPGWKRLMLGGGRTAQGGILCCTDDGAELGATTGLALPWRGGRGIDVAM